MKTSLIQVWWAYGVPAVIALFAWAIHAEALAYKPTWDGLILMYAVVWVAWHLGAVWSRFWLDKR